MGGEVFEPTNVFGECLTGRYIKRIKVSDTKTVIQFDTDLDTYTFFANGDCCSDSWFEHLNGIDCLKGKRVNRVIVHEMPEGRVDSTHDYLQFYGWTFETDVGRCDLEMRNASNGYYGGWVSLKNETKFNDSDYTLNNVREDF